MSFKQASCAFVVMCVVPSAALAFVTLEQTPPDASALRWSAARHVAIGGVGLPNSLQVGVEPAFAERLAQAVTGHIDPTDVADVQNAIRSAFAAWEDQVLRFEVTFEADAQRGTDRGSEIDVFLVPESDPVFTDNNYFGVTFTDATPVADRLLTNGMVSSGPAITGADIFINETILASVAPALTRDQQLAALQRLLMHEIGHALGLHHPNEFPESNYDTDSDPLNAMEIDPDDPTAGLQLSPNINPNSVVSNRPGTFEALFFTTLQNDERGGRDVLYPLHAPECPGDCDDNRTVAVNELVQSVKIALDRDTIGACFAADHDRDGHIRVNELVGAVRNALSGCAADRHLVTFISVSDFMQSIPVATNRGTVRFQVAATWDPDADVSLIDIRATQAFAPRIQLVKTGAFLSFVAADAGGAEAQAAARIDGWTSVERHEVTITWTRAATGLYIDGSLIGTTPLTEPVALPSGAMLKIGQAGSNLVLENLDVFAGP